MTSTVGIAMFGAAFIAMAGAIFGVGVARTVWAQDLQQAKRLRTIWTESEAALNSRIDSQVRIIAAHERTIAALHSQLELRK